MAEVNPNDIEDTGMWLDPDLVDATKNAGLASSPPHLADPKLHVASNIGVWGFHWGVLGAESQSIRQALQGLATGREWLLLETLPLGEWSNALADGSGVTAFSVDRAVLERFTPRAEMGCRRIVGEVRDAFRHLKMNPTKAGRVLVWPGMVFNRISTQGFPYLLRYIAQVMNPKDSLVLSGLEGSALKLQGVCRTEQVQRNGRQLVDWALNNSSAGGQFGWDSAKGELAFVWKEGGDKTLRLNTWWSLDAERVESTFEFTGLEHTYQCTINGVTSWVLRKRK